MNLPSFSRLARFVRFASLGGLILALHAACARSVDSGFAADSLPAFATDAGGPPQLFCISTECPAPHATCPGEPGLCTTNLQNDVDHCGSCDTKCPSKAPNGSFVCSGGQCHVVCDEYTADCNHSAADGCETPTDSDPANCGACGNACKDGVSCWRGACGCPNGYTQCGTECVKLDSDNLNCGACGTTCTAPTNLTDPKWKCGAGVSPAHTKWQCMTASCDLTCASGYADCNTNFCGDGCETKLSDDPDNCGACGHKCELGKTCGGGTCLCPAGTTNCNGTCVDVNVDATNCGGCGITCPGPKSASPRHPGGGSPACTAGQCSYVCYPGFANCDGKDDNGCEANLDTSSLHCGSCATPCPLGPGQPCVVGKCLTRDCDAGGPVK